MPVSSRFSLRCEPIEGTILLDWGDRGDARGAFARVTLDPDIDVQVGYDGLIRYALRHGDTGRVWWFAGTGEVREQRSEVATCARTHPRASSRRSSTPT